MTSLSCTFLGFLADAILFTLYLLLRFCLGLYELVCWGVSLVCKGSHRSTRDERLANWRLDQRIERDSLLKKWIAAASGARRAAAAGV